MDPQARLEAALERLAEGRSILLKAKDAGPPCVQCRYFSPANLPDIRGRTKGPFCGHPAHVRHAFNPVDGAVDVALVVSPEAARGDDGLCGFEAVLFEKAPSQVLKDFARDMVLWVVGLFALIGVLVTAEFVGHFL